MIRHLLQRVSARTLALGLCFGAAAFVSGATATADVIATYDLEYVDATRTAVATTVPGVTASRYFAHGTTQIYSTDNHGKRIDGGRGGTVATIQDAVANDEFGRFTFTVASGMQLNLSSLNIGMQITRGADDESLTVHLRSSLDGFANDIDIATLMGDSSVNVVDGTGEFDLSGAAFQGLTGTTTFQLYMVTDIGSRTDGSQYIRIMPNVVLNGTVAPIPEPGSLALCAVGGTLLMLRRRGGVTR